MFLPYLQYPHHKHKNHTSVVTICVHLLNNTQRSLTCCKQTVVLFKIKHLDGHRIGEQALVLHNVDFFFCCCPRGPLLSKALTQQIYTHFFAHICVYAYRLRTHTYVYMLYIST